MKKFRELIRTDRWIFPFLKAQKWGVLWSIVLSFMTIFAAAALMFVSGFLISRAAQRPSNILLIYVPIVLTRGFGIARPVFRYVERLVSHNWVLRIVSKSRRRLYQSAASTAASIRSKLQTGKVLSLLADDLDQLQNLYLRTIFPVGAGIMLYLGSSLALGFLNVYFALFWFFMLGIIMVVLPWLSFALNRHRVIQQKALQNELYTDATDAIMGMQDWVLSGRQKDLVTTQGRVMKTLSRVKYQSMRFGWWRDFTVQALALIVLLALLAWSDWQYAGNYMARNYIAAFSLALIPLVDTFLSVNQGVAESSFYEDSIKRLNELPEPSELPARQERKLPANFDISFQDVSFAYDKKEIIRDMDLTIHSGEKVALLGRSGAGKTTMLKLLAGDIKPDDGTVRLGDYNPADFDDLSALVAVLDQQAYLFDTTILNNVRMGNLRVSDQEVEAAIRDAGLAPLIASLPDGVHTQMLEAGQRFSGGERQRFALARVLLQQAPIVILDEPTVSLDPKTEHEVLDQIFTALADRTIIWVTHHLTGIDEVNQVYFLENGEFTMQGSPKDLAQNSDHFKALLAMDQF
ncbi:thiol reductant ABC exporter subunit CydC [Eupransor demetentiae]|uniref:Fused ATPase and permease components (CydC) n=1 Tax=Eupransor demetentiae TaxID=3109584 RepID=A0ABM9N393_9LACO|nr:ABC-type transport system involved in cytochrome bd biosynthesis [Lactobacillaceae bacterium LMG 33000]